MELKTVSKEIAIKLKKIGFDYKCDKQAIDNNIRSSISIALDIATLKLPVNIEILNIPTLALVIKWLRDCKYVKIGIEYNWHYAKYQFRIGIVGCITTDIKFYDNYEDAEEKAIEKAIELLS